MASSRTPSAQTLREIREIGRPLQAINKQRSALNDQVNRLRDDLIKMADDREVGRYRGAMKRRAAVSTDEAQVVSEATWLQECGELSKTFDYSYPVGQLRAFHMVEYAQQEAFLLLDGVDNIVWFLRGWERRINRRIGHTDDRIILGLGPVHTKENGITSSIFFNRVTVEDYNAWYEHESTIID